MNHFESSVINLIWTKKLVLLYYDKGYFLIVMLSAIMLGYLNWWVIEWTIFLWLSMLSTARRNKINRLLMQPCISGLFVLCLCALVSMLNHNKQAISLNQ